MAKKICPCGCRQLVKAGNTYAQRGCGMRLRWAHRPFNAKAIAAVKRLSIQEPADARHHDHETIVFGRTAQERKPAAAVESWWVGLSRDALNAEAAKRSVSA